jgi:hypothetical protein
MKDAAQIELELLDRTAALVREQDGRPASYFLALTRAVAEQLAEIEGRIPQPKPPQMGPGWFP